MVLAAGEGIRLRPMTTDVPKPMVPVRGRPLLEHTVASLARQGVRDLVLNLHHCPETVRSHFGTGEQWGAHIQYSPEPRLLGTAGALTPWRAFFDSTFLVVYGDNLTTCDLSRLCRFHESAHALVSVALYWRDDPRQSGIADVDDHGRIRRFLEKPREDELFSRWVNAGLLVLEPGVIDLIPRDRPSDFGRELLPRWIAEGRPVFGYKMSSSERLWWIDTPDDIARVHEELTEREKT